MAKKTASKGVQKNKQSSKKWFIKVRGSYLPNSRQGRLTYIPFIAYLVAVMLTISDQTAAWPMKIMMISVQFVAAAVVMTWVAASHS